MSRLLDRALDQNTRGGSEVELYHHLLDQLVADEARILGALSDGSSSPMVNVYTWLSHVFRAVRRWSMPHSSVGPRMSLCRKWFRSTSATYCR